MPRTGPWGGAALGAGAGVISLSIVGLLSVDVSRVGVLRWEGEVDRTMGSLISLPW